MTDVVVEAMARAMWEAYAGQHLHPADWPSWGELVAQGHQGMHRTNEFRGYARAAIRACHDAGGLVLREVPGRMPWPNYQEYMQRTAGWDDALAKVRAAAVEVGP